MDFEQELKASFLEEVTGLLEEAERYFLRLEENPEDKSILDQIFRVAHNVKGSSRAVGFEELGTFTHKFETLLLRCKTGEFAVTPTTISLLLACNDHLGRFIEALRGDFNASVPSDEIIQRIESFTPADALVEASPNEASVPDASAFEEPAEIHAADLPPPAAFESEADILARLDQPFVVAADPVVSEVATPVPTPSVAPTPPPLASVAAPTPAATPSPKAEGAKAAGGNTPAPEESIRVSLSRLERLVNFVGELVIFQTVLQEQAYGSNPTLLRRTVHQMGKVTKEIQDLSMSLRMVPLKQTFQKMQRIVRDTSSVLNKKVKLQIEGEETEVDKTIVESLGDPLVHLIRNACDHGIETPEERVARGKPDTGTVRLAAFHRGGRLVIEIKDDGNGIDANRLRQKALEKGILRPGQNISDREAVNLIFHAGFSTKAQVTEVSGRGVGMDVVKTNIEAIQGEIEVETAVGQGSTFRVLLPLTLAIIEGLVVKSDQDRFIIPLAHVHESVKIEAGDLHPVANMGEIFKLRDEPLPLLRLSKLLNQKRAAGAAGARKPNEDGGGIAIVVRTQAQPYAVHVDDIVGQHQVVIKKLGTEMQRTHGFGGSAILGDGRPALILELQELVGFSKEAA